MSRSARMFSAGTRPLFSVVCARALICKLTLATRALSSATVGRFANGGVGSLSMACAATFMSIPPRFMISGVRSRQLGGFDFGWHGRAVGRVLINQGVDRIVDVDEFRLADEDRMRAIGNGGGLLAENVYLGGLEIADAFRRDGPIAQTEPCLRRQRPAERSGQRDLVSPQQVHAEPARQQHDVVEQAC